MGGRAIRGVLKPVEAFCSLLGNCETFDIFDRGFMSFLAISVLVKAAVCPCLSSCTGYVGGKYHVLALLASRYITSLARTTSPHRIAPHRTALPPLPTRRKAPLKPRPTLNFWLSPNLSPTRLPPLALPLRALLLPPLLQILLPLLLPHSLPLRDALLSAPPTPSRSSSSLSLCA